MSSDVPEPTRAEVLAVVEKTRATIEDLPGRLSRVENKTDKAVWGVVGIAFGLLIVAVGFLWNDNRANNDQNERFIDFAQCQAQYNQANVNVSKIRSDLTTQLNDAQAKRDSAIAKIVAAKKGDINVVFNTYNAALVKIEKARADHPLPLYPDCYRKYIQPEPVSLTGESD